MKRILIFNFGSSSLKWSLLEAQTEKIIQKGSEIGFFSEDKHSFQIIHRLLDSIPQPDAVGHRLVHGGDLFNRTRLINPIIRNQLESLIELDPLHMRPALEGLDLLSQKWPSLPQFVAFDTAFHATLPVSTGYALPSDWVKRWGLKRFGFHGLSLSYAVQQIKRLTGKIPERLIICHLGSGCSITAIKNGCSIDTTMGFTPLDGLVMGTRSGSIDPGLLLYLQLKKSVTASELLETLTFRSGLLGTSGLSGDLQEIQKAASSGSSTAALAYEQFILSAKRFIGAMTAVLGGLDTVIFTGGIGENNAQVRQDLLSSFSFNGAAIDTEINAKGSDDRDISSPNSLIKIFVIGGREDLAILRDMIRLDQIH